MILPTSSVGNSNGHKDDDIGKEFIQEFVQSCLSSSFSFSNNILELYSFDSVSHEKSESGKGTFCSFKYFSNSFTWLFSFFRDSSLFA